MVYPVMVVVADEGEVIVDGPGLPATAFHNPEPVPFIVATPPGKSTQLKNWSAPASGMAVTTMTISSLHAPWLHVRV